jgi:hypothetical protein
VIKSWVDREFKREKEREIMKKGRERKRKSGVER